MAEKGVLSFYFVFPFRGLKASSYKPVDDIPASPPAQARVTQSAPVNGIAAIPSKMPTTIAKIGTAFFEMEMFCLISWTTPVTIGNKRVAIDKIWFMSSPTFNGLRDAGPEK